MFNSNEFGVHLMAVAVIICTSIYVIPNLTTNLKNYEKGQGVLMDTRINEREYTGKLFVKKIERKLILNLNNGIELKLSKEYSNYWDKLQDKTSIGKVLTYYSRNNITDGSNPVQLELDNKIIYNFKDNIFWGYIFILMTILYAIYSGWKIYKFVKSN